ncbi:unnamed protein product, partial [marine sediment metagenome]
DPVWIECPIYQDPISTTVRDPSWLVVQTKFPDDWDFQTGETVVTQRFTINYHVARCPTVWDTTLIPYDALIVQAYMHRYGYRQSPPPLNPEFWYYWLDFSSWDGTVDPLDYARINFLTDIVAKFFCTDAMAVRAWHDIPLISNMLSVIKPAGLTKFAAVTDTDF